MAEELNYVTVKFNSNHSPSEGVIYEDVRSEQVTWTPEKQGEVEDIYDDVRNKESPADMPHILQGNVSKVLKSRTPHTLATAALGVLCVLLMSVVVALTLHVNSSVAERRSDSANLTAQNLTALELGELRRTLAAEREQLNRTLEAVFRLKVFHVASHCPQKVLSLCKPCPLGWLLFRSKCYLFLHLPYHAHWKTQEESANDCCRRNARLLTIQSQEEQEFVTNETMYYNDDKHGYWMGLTKDIITDKWEWSDGRALNQTFWRDETYYYRSNRCALTSKKKTSTSLHNWSRADCSMKNRYICQTEAFLVSELG
ncbi:C-type lectin domain family 9 member A [Corythoichthys intestinalis]|uniref:C-type lectin domain family 9 member A n=1 Tax=Corythoichthys intestinalis TaxID=161448 RepID=UPI0025A65123|nr:C-type lectin domain family 9 member A [Corythoichthys intestinalis]